MGARKANGCCVEEVIVIGLCNDLVNHGCFNIAELLLKNDLMWPNASEPIQNAIHDSPDRVDIIIVEAEKIDVSSKAAILVLVAS